MPRRRVGWVPKLTHLKGPGKGRVRIPSKPDVYLGEAGSWPAGQERPPEAIRRAYEREVAEWLHAKANAAPSQRAAGSWTCGEVCRAYVASLAGRPSQQGARNALRPVEELYADLAAAEFTPKRFCVVRSRHLERGVAPRCANDYMAKVRAAWRWAARPEQDGVPAPAALALSLVAPLVDEEDVPLPEVEPSHVLAVLPHCRPVVAAMLELQLLTGMRPGEVCDMLAGDLERPEGQPWLYRPGSYKSRRSAAVRKAGGRKVWLGPRGRDIVAPRLVGKADGDAVFPSQRGRCFTTQGYAVAVEKACHKAGVEVFTPRQVRHTTATVVEEALGLEYAQNVLGHRKPDTTLIYARAQDRRAKKAMERLG
jgi:integrase